MASDITTEPTAETDAEFAQRFAALAARWHEETAHMSRMDMVAAHPAHREIVAMGERVVPLLLADLERNGEHWFMALGEITGAHPVPRENRGRVREMAAAWVAWGREQGYRWERAV
jgi:hypothetical protein